jgi:gliding motility-associated-like protein
LAIVYGASLSGTQLNATSSAAGTLIYTPSTGTVLNAGANQILSVSFTPTDMANYNPASKTVQLTVNKATPTITWANPAAITYGTQLTSTQLSATASVSGVLTYSPSAGTVLNAGANQVLSVNFAPTDAANYNSVTNLQRLITVNKAIPIITWPTPLPIKVGVALSPTQLNATANVPGSFTYSPTSGTILGAGANQILSTDFIPTDAANYNSVMGTQVLITVNLKDNPIITWSNPASITYGTPLSATQLNATSSVVGSFVYSPPLGTILNSGVSQVLSATFTPTDAITYNSIVSTVQITVNKALLTATAVDASRSYGQTNPTFTINYAGFVNGDVASAIDTRPTASCSAVAGSTAGSSFPITLAGGVDNNYTFNYVNGTLTIVKASLIAKPDDKSRSYGLTNPVFTISYTGFVSGDNASSITPPLATTTAVPTSNVGTYAINLSGGTSTNYNFTLQSGTLTINPSPLTAKADDKTKSYGQANPTLTISYSGFLNTDNAASITEPTITTTATASTGVGSVPIILSGGSAVNYSILLQNGTLTISKTILTIKADDKSRIYGQANPANSITYSGFVNGENASSITPPTISGPSATSLSNVGNYPISLSGGLAANYSLNLQPGTLTITKAVLQAIADNKQRVYGQANPSLTVTYSGFVNGENASAIATLPQASTSASSSSSVGNYSITAGGGLANNYDFSYVAGVFTITKASLVAKADDKSRLYGQANPALTISFSGFVNGDNQSSLSTQPIATTVATPSSSVASYAITVSGGSATNYDLGYVNGALLIGKSNLTATANDANRLFGTTGSPLTISYTGFANGETPAVIDTPPVASTTAIISSPIGPYPITVSGGADDNYNFTYVSGTLTITSTAQPTIKNFSILTNEDTPFAFTYNSFYQNFVSVPGDNIVQVKIVTLPTNGVLMSLGANVVVGDLIKVKNGVLDELKYMPNLNYNGADNFKWNVFNGTVSAVSDAQVTIVISPVNDPPVLGNVETKELPYSLGDPAILITKQLVLNDVDDSFMYSALISVSEKHSGGDVLSWDKTISTKITSTFDNATGQLRLKGKDSKSNYEKALNSILFSSPVSSDTTLSRKKVSFVVNDSIDNSNIVFRKIQAETFPDLNIVNSFTPNDDRINDYWDFMNLNAYTVIAISIFDRNGLKVFECTAGDCKWDGKSRGKELPSGPYFYTIDLNNGKRKYQGVVTILK